ncbi:hypothetical protein [Streptomyces sp. NPDC056632]|uniref:hypothetical protein n=1 Tax=Streptomyces sp. NPDC056632 TaxID=3345884 RepID=UPI0036C7FAC8
MPSNVQTPRPVDEAVVDSPRSGHVDTHPYLSTTDPDAGRGNSGDGGGNDPMLVHDQGLPTPHADAHHQPTTSTDDGNNGESSGVTGDDAPMLVDSDTQDTGRVSLPKGSDPAAGRHPGTALTGLINQSESVIPPLSTTGFDLPTPHAGTQQPPTTTNADANNGESSSSATTLTHQANENDPMLLDRAQPDFDRAGFDTTDLNTTDLNTTDLDFTDLDFTVFDYMGFDLELFDSTLVDTPAIEPTQSPTRQTHASGETGTDASQPMVLDEQDRYSDLPTFDEHIVDTDLHGTQTSATLAGARREHPHSEDDQNSTAGPVHKRRRTLHGDVAVPPIVPSQHRIGQEAQGTDASSQTSTHLLTGRTSPAVDGGPVGQLTDWVRDTPVRSLPPRPQLGALLAFLVLFAMKRAAAGSPVTAAEAVSAVNGAGHVVTDAEERLFLGVLQATALPHVHRTDGPTVSGTAQEMALVLRAAVQALASKQLSRPDLLVQSVLPYAGPELIVQASGWVMGAQLVFARGLLVAAVRHLHSTGAGPDTIVSTLFPGSRATAFQQIALDHLIAPGTSRPSRTTQPPAQNTVPVTAPVAVPPTGTGTHLSMTLADVDLYADDSLDIGISGSVPPNEGITFDDVPAPSPHAPDGDGITNSIGITGNTTGSATTAGSSSRARPGPRTHIDRPVTDTGRTLSGHNGTWDPVTRFTNWLSYELVDLPDTNAPLNRLLTFFVHYSLGLAQDNIWNSPEDLVARRRGRQHRVTPDEEGLHLGLMQATALPYVVGPRPAIAPGTPQAMTAVLAAVHMAKTNGQPVDHAALARQTLPDADAALFAQATGWAMGAELAYATGDLSLLLTAAQDLHRGGTPTDTILATLFFNSRPNEFHRAALLHLLGTTTANATGTDAPPAPSNLLTTTTTTPSHPIAQPSATLSLSMNLDEVDLYADDSLDIDLSSTSGDTTGIQPADPSTFAPFPQAPLSPQTTSWRRPPAPLVIGPKLQVLRNTAEGFTYMGDENVVTEHDLANVVLLISLSRTNADLELKFGQYVDHLMSGLSASNATVRLGAMFRTGGTYVIEKAASGGGVMAPDQMAQVMALKGERGLDGKPLKRNGVVRLIWKDTGLKRGVVVEGVWAMMNWADGDVRQALADAVVEIARDMKRNGMRLDEHLIAGLIWRDDRAIEYQVVVVKAILKERRAEVEEDLDLRRITTDSRTTAVVQSTWRARRPVWPAPPGHLTVGPKLQLLRDTAAAFTYKKGGLPTTDDNRANLVLLIALSRTSKVSAITRVEYVELTPDLGVESSRTQIMGYFGPGGAYLREKEHGVYAVMSPDQMEQVMALRGALGNDGGPLTPVRAADRIWGDKVANRAPVVEAVWAMMNWRNGGALQMLAEAVVEIALDMTRSGMRVSPHTIAGLIWRDGRALEYQVVVVKAILKDRRAEIGEEFDPSDVEPQQESRDPSVRTEAAVPLSAPAVSNVQTDSEPANLSLRNPSRARPTDWLTPPGQLTVGAKLQELRNKVIAFKYTKKEPLATDQDQADIALLISLGRTDEHGGLRRMDYVAHLKPEGDSDAASAWLAGEFLAFGATLAGRKGTGDLMTPTQLEQVMTARRDHPGGTPFNVAKQFWKKSVLSSRKFVVSGIWATMNWRGGGVVQLLAEAVVEIALDMRHNGMRVDARLIAELIWRDARAIEYQVVMVKAILRDRREEIGEDFDPSDVEPQQESRETRDSAVAVVHRPPGSPSAGSSVIVPDISVGDESRTTAVQGGTPTNWSMPVDEVYEQPDDFMEVEPLGPQYGDEDGPEHVTSDDGMTLDRLDISQSPILVPDIPTPVPQGGTVIDRQQPFTPDAGPALSAEVHRYLTQLDQPRVTLPPDPAPEARLVHVLHVVMAEAKKGVHLPVREIAARVSTAAGRLPDRVEELSLLGAMQSTGLPYLEMGGATSGMDAAGLVGPGTPDQMTVLLAMARSYWASGRTFDSHHLIQQTFPGAGAELTAQASGWLLGGRLLRLSEPLAKALTAAVRAVTNDGLRADTNVISTKLMGGGPPTRFRQAAFQHWTQLLTAPAVDPGPIPGVMSGQPPLTVDGGPALTVDGGPVGQLTDWVRDAPVRSLPPRPQLGALLAFLVLFAMKRAAAGSPVTAAEAVSAVNGASHVVTAAEERLFLGVLQATALPHVHRTDGPTVSGTAQEMALVLRAVVQALAAKQLSRPDLLVQSVLPYAGPELIVQASGWVMGAQLVFARGLLVAAVRHLHSTGAGPDTIVSTLFPGSRATAFQQIALDHLIAPGTSRPSRTTQPPAQNTVVRDGRNTVAPPSGRTHVSDPVGEFNTWVASSVSSLLSDDPTVSQTLGGIFHFVRSRAGDGTPVSALDVIAYRHGPDHIIQPGDESLTIGIMEALGLLPAGTDPGAAPGTAAQMTAVLAALRQAWQTGGPIVADFLIRQTLAGAGPQLVAQARGWLYAGALVRATGDAARIVAVARHLHRQGADTAAIARTLLGTSQPDAFQRAAIEHWLAAPAPAPTPTGAGTGIATRHAQRWYRDILTTTNRTINSNLDSSGAHPTDTRTAYTTAVPRIGDAAFGDRTVTGGSSAYRLGSDTTFERPRRPGSGGTSPLPSRPGTPATPTPSIPTTSAGSLVPLTPQDLSRAERLLYGAQPVPVPLPLPLPEVAGTVLGTTDPAAVVRLHHHMLTHSSRYRSHYAGVRATAEAATDALHLLRNHAEAHGLHPGTGTWWHTHHTHHPAPEPPAWFTRLATVLDTPGVIDYHHALAVHPQDPEHQRHMDQAHDLVRNTLTTTGTTGTTGTGAWRDPVNITPDLYWATVAVAHHLHRSADDAHARRLLEHIRQAADL